MKAVITGGAGFIGSHLVDNLVQAGHQVLVIDNFSTGSESNLEKSTSSSLLEVEKEEIQSHQVSAILKKYMPDVVFHFAAQMNVRASVKDPLFDTNANVIGTVNMLQASVDSKVKDFIFASTGGAIYGDKVTLPASEDSVVRADSPYGVGKRCGELYLDLYSRKNDMRTFSLRFGNVYGPRQTPKGEAGVVAIFCNRILNSEPLIVNGDGLQTRDYVYIDDVIKGVLKCHDYMRKSQSKRFYDICNIGTGIETTVKDLVDELSKVVRLEEIGKAVDYQYGPEQPGESRRNVLCLQKLNHIIPSWDKDMVKVAEGIKQTYLSWRHVNCTVSP